MLVMEEGGRSLASFNFQGSANSKSDIHMVAESAASSGGEMQRNGRDVLNWQKVNRPPPEKICIRSKQSFSFVSSSSSSPACQASRMELRLPPAWSRHPPLMLEGPLWRCTTFDTHCPDVAQQWETVQHRTKSTSKMTTWEVRWVLCGLPYKFRVQHHLTENNLCPIVALF